jgi:hemoglobin
MRVRILMAALLLTGAAGLARADEKPIDRTEVDKRVVTVVYETALLGTKIFNDDKNYEGTYRLYQGTLNAVYPMLDHRPKLQTMIKMRLERAAKMKPSDAAFELRACLDEVQKEIAPGKDDVPKKTALWDRLGGEKGVRDVFSKSVLAAGENPKITFVRNKDLKFDAKEFEQKLAEWAASKSGGTVAAVGDKKPVDYLKSLKMTNDEFDALTATVVDQFKKAKVADADIAEFGKSWEELRKEVVAPKN